MSLDDYLKTYYWKQSSDAAEELGISVTHLSLVRNGRINMSFSLACRIVDWSNGLVTLEELKNNTGERKQND